MLKVRAIVILLAGCVTLAQPAVDPLAEGIALLEKGDAEHSLPFLRRAVELNGKSRPPTATLVSRSGKLGPSIRQSPSFARRSRSIPSTPRRSITWAPP